MQRVRHANRGRLLPPDIWSYPIWDLHLFIKPKPHYLLVTLTEYDIFTEIYITELESFQQNICNGCGMPTGDADSSGHLVLSHFGTCMCSNVETNLSRTCLVSGPLNFEHPSALLFCSSSFFICITIILLYTLIVSLFKDKYDKLYCQSRFTQAGQINLIVKLAGEPTRQIHHFSYTCIDVTTSRLQIKVQLISSANRTEYGVMKENSNLLARH